jgi:imidazolonepropionase-like amidohydrolase
LGTVEAGKVADLVLVAEDPLRNIAAVKRVSRVMLNGVWLE